ncbi:MAG TPA: NAD-dependent epimerase/dehydratase family protein [Phenylobacterium sp.]|uniref:NAD-dependent epimerase/dehydratase family protein n=1 Tax=Phenylobacterium sp. TaxID=1871053 RepID=UPI002B49231B|nr:NAD-dependent epimerase/dehydratase family protein [Phenylobacterium sp.]HKR89699.1 NAD-dependent epimerase/dehydratase family protein [Phenylobacterium sp.]
MRVAAVTGATGFLGRRLVGALAAEGWRVRVLARRDAILAAPEGVEPEVVVGALSDEVALAGLCRGAEVVVHAAGLIKARAGAHFAAVNAAGAERVAQAARRADVEQTLLVSSLAAREPQLSPYAASKRAGEEAARKVLGDRLTVLRPPAIYGPGDLETLGVFEAALRLPLAPVFDSRARIAMIHVDDAARQIAAAAGRAPERPVVALCDVRPDGYSWREIVGAAGKAVGRRSVMVPLPSAALSLAGAAGATLRLFGANPILTPGKAREMRHLDWSLRPEERWSSAPAPRFDLEGGFAHTVAWWRVAGKLRS